MFDRCAGFTAITVEAGHPFSTQASRSSQYRATQNRAFTRERDRSPRDIVAPTLAHCTIEFYPPAAIGRDADMSTASGFVVPAGGGKHFGSPTPGRSFALKLRGHETAGSIMMFEETLPPGTASLHHIHHGSDEVAWVLDGEFTFKIGDEVTVGGPGTCAFMPRDVPHAWKNTGTETGCVLFLYTPRATDGKSWAQTRFKAASCPMQISGADVQLWLPPARG
jgi:quercetin dioxygenase-like cupin family protein